MYTQLMKEALREVMFGSGSVKELFDYCREQFNDNAEELQRIKNFDNDYRRQTSIWSYTYECCLIQYLIVLTDYPKLILSSTCPSFLVISISTVRRISSKTIQYLFCLSKSTIINSRLFKTNENQRRSHFVQQFPLSTSKNWDVSLEFACKDRWKMNDIGWPILNARFLHLIFHLTCKAYAKVFT